MTIAVELDGTLAKFDYCRGAYHIGEPIVDMLERVRRWVDTDLKVVIFTARAEDADARHYIAKWLIDNGIGGLEITNVKRKEFVEIWDNKSVAIQTNTGKITNTFTKG